MIRSLNHHEASARRGFEPGALEQPGQPAGAAARRHQRLERRAITIPKVNDRGAAIFDGQQRGQRLGLGRAPDHELRPARQLPSSRGPAVTETLPSLMPAMTAGTCTRTVTRPSRPSLTFRPGRRPVGTASRAAAAGLAPTASARAAARAPTPASHQQCPATTACQHPARRAARTGSVATSSTLA